MSKDNSPDKIRRQLEFLASRTRASGRYSFFHESGKKTHSISVRDNQNPVETTVSPIGGMSWNKQTGEVDMMGVHPDHRALVVPALLHEALRVAEKEGFEPPSRGYLMTPDSARLVRKVNPEAMNDPRAHVTKNSAGWISQVGGIGPRSYELD